MGDDGDDPWQSDRYEEHHDYVYRYGSDVIELLQPAQGERVLDLGCGTGHLTKQISESGATAVGIDASPEMVERARSEYPELTFRIEDATRMEFRREFDAVFSNATLHWIDRQDELLDGVKRALRPGGRFVAELGGKGNVATVIDALTEELGKRGYSDSNPMYFPSLGEYTSRVEDHGLEVRFARLFDRPTELGGGRDGLRSFFRMFGDRFLGDLDEDEWNEVVGTVEDELRPELFGDGSWTVGFRRLRFRAVRP